MKQNNYIRHGCTQTPTLYQLLTYLLYFPNMLTCFLLISLLDESATHFILLGLLTLLSLFSSIKTTLSCPTDDFLIQQVQHRRMGKPFNYESQKLDSYCDICDAYVKENTKHCKHCNRCSQEFDHHCKWVNNCVGNKNYKIFIMMITTTMLQLFYTAIVYIRIIKLYNTEHEKLLINNEIQKFHFYDENDLDIKYTLSIIMLVDSSIFSILLFQLFIFHIYLMIKGITTYEFIVKSDIKRINPQINVLNVKPEVLPNGTTQTNLNLQVNNKNTMYLIELNCSEQQLAQEPQEKQGNSTDIVFNNQVLA
ncbi:unnamed protein product (macronuclear) [Paramecium tetraurelia]|uniref:Palmitoyltransferase n=1 Tax=Paramecium tetraurelia TaxID=5888 RepID=A0CTE7_PARTE|nr:uncharacterized protein GSPATT00010298001 [Paramecium tetraurelia]CAK74064.1 unnamed protein product [Paramecium tetraurelia]|eukprot:XP_001441461.1 hypothetical protein (macronuclear) [Paramecium tetraurelia strain d4-2]